MYVRVCVYVVCMYIYTQFQKYGRTRTVFRCGARFFALPRAFRSRRQPSSTVFCCTLSALHRLLLRRFDVLQSGRPPTTPLDCARREQSTGSIREAPRCVVAEIFATEDFTEDCDPMWYNLGPVQLAGNGGGRSV